MLWIILLCNLATSQCEAPHLDGQPASYATQAACKTAAAALTPPAGAEYVCQPTRAPH